MIIPKTPIVENPQLFDLAFSYIQIGLSEGLGWLDHAFGKAERLVNKIENKKYFSPNVYIGSNQYLGLAPDSKIGNFSFFWVEDPQLMDWVKNGQGSLTAPFSLIFWFDIRTIENNDNRNKESIKASILRVLNNDVFMKSGSFKINRIHELAENIYKGFTLDEIDNQFLMHPFCGFRFEGIITIDEPCY